VIRHGDPDREFSVERRLRGDREPTLLNPQQDLGVQRVQLRLVRARHDEPETHDVQGRRREQFEPGMHGHEPGEVMGLAHVLMNQPRVGVQAVCLERHPDLEGAEAARELHAALGEREAAGRDAPVEGREIRRRHVERRPVRLLIADEGAADLVGHVQPLVQIERDRIGVLESRDERPKLGDQRGKRAERAVDVEPGLLVPAERRERAQVIGRARIHGAGVAHDADRSPSGGSVGGELPPQGLHVNRVVGSDGNRAQASWPRPSSSTALRTEECVSVEA